MNYSLISLTKTMHSLNLTTSRGCFLEPMSNERRKLELAELLQAKDRVLEHWRSLPPEHQATLLLVLFQEVMDKDMAGWAINALFTLYLQDQVRGKRVLPSSHANTS